MVPDQHVLSAGGSRGAAGGHDEAESTAQGSVQGTGAQIAGPAPSLSTLQRHKTPVPMNVPTNVPTLQITRTNDVPTTRWHALFTTFAAKYHPFY